MYPIYKYMEPYPQPASHQKNHIPYPQHYYKGWEVIPPQFKIDPPESPATFKPCPHSGSLGYPNPNPTECHGCCNHHHPFGYYSYRPPHSYLPLHPPMCYYGPYPPHRDMNPPYFIPSPHYPAEQTWSEYDKNMVRDHCCGCPNHSCNGKADSKVKIEEEKPDLERKGSDSDGLTKLQNYPYPIIWMPPGYMKDKEMAKPLESDSKMWNGWVPLDLNSIRSLNEGGDEKRTNDQQTEDKKPQSQWPIIWLPGYDKAGEIEKKDVKDIEVSPKVTEDSPSRFKIIPVKHLENKNQGEKPGVAGDTSGNGPLALEEDEAKPKSALKEKKTKPKNIEVKQIEENGGKKLETATKKSSSSPVKTSKLPPVCLRVDPLPKKKNGNGTSRCPSPPAANDRGNQNSKKQEPVVDKEDGQPKNMEAKITNVEEKPSQITEAKEGKSKTIEIKVLDPKDKPSQINETSGGLPKEKGVQVVRVEEKMAVQSGGGQQPMEDVIQGRDVMKSVDQAKCQVNDATNLTEEVGPVTKKVERDDRGYENTEAGKEVSESQNEDKKKAMRKILSDVEAAVLIQAAYRGFEVRRWEPLKKLRQIARIRKQVDDVRDRIQDFESSAKLLPDGKQCSHQQVIINETIMSLLLQLDTIKGLHPDAREIRKSVARELVCLQEKLDSLATPTATEELPTEKACRDQKTTTQENGCVLMESTPKAAEVSELTDRDVASDASQSNEAVETVTSNVEEQGKETLELSLVGVEGSESKQEESTDHPTSVERGNSSTSSGELSQLTEVHTVNDGRHSSEVEMLVDSPPSVNAEPLEEDFIELNTAKDEKKNSSAVNEELVKSLQSDEAWDSIVEKLSEASLMVAEEEASPTLEQVPSLKDDQVEELLKSQEANKESTSGPGSPETVSIGGKSVDPATRDDLSEVNNASEMEEEKADTVSIEKGEDDSEQQVEPLSVFPEQSSPVEQEKDAEYKAVEGESALEDAENQLLFSGSEVDAMAVLVTPELPEDPDQVNNVEVSEGGNKLEAGAHDPVTGEMGEHDSEQRISEEGRIEWFIEEETMHTNSEIFEATTLRQEVKVKNHTLEARVATDAESFPDMCQEAITLPLEVEEKNQLPSVSARSEAEVVPEVKSLPPLCIPKSDVKHVFDAAIGSVPVSCSVDPVPPGEVESNKDGKHLAGENEKLKEMVEKLLEAGKQQLTVISDLNGRVRDLEKKLAKKKKMKIRLPKAVSSSEIKQRDNLANQRASAASMV